MTTEYTNDPFHVKVITTSLVGNTEFERIKIIDFSDYEQRRWLTSHFWWGLKNNCMVSVTPTDEAVTFIPRKMMKR